MSAVSGKKVCIVGAGWAGLAAAIGATQAGHRVTLLEASRALGGRARTLAQPASHGLPNDTPTRLDNGQHILIGAYRETLDLMRLVGLDPPRLLRRLPLRLQFPDGSGLRLPDRSAPWNLLAGVWGVSDWSLGDKFSLLKTVWRWQTSGFQCSPTATVAELCAGIAPRVTDHFINPLCVAALNTPAHQASGQMFLTVLCDTLKTPPPAPWTATTDLPPRPRALAGTDLLLPTVDLGALFPHAAAAWLQVHGSTVRVGVRASAPRWSAGVWRVADEDFDAVVWATSAPHAVQALQTCVDSVPSNLALPLQHWLRQAKALQYEAIATVYAFSRGLVLPAPMLSLASGPQAPAQFVFDRGQLGGPVGLIACVASACTGTHAGLEAQVLQQAQDQLAPLLQDQPLIAVQTVVEKRATLACTPGLQRPAQRIAPGLLACGDYVYAPYPSTLEGAVRSGRMAALALDETDGVADGFANGVADGFFDQDAGTDR